MKAVPNQMTTEVTLKVNWMYYVDATATVATTAMQAIARILMKIANPSYQQQ